MSENTAVNQDDYNKLVLQNERLSMGQADLLRRIDLLKQEFDHLQKNRAFTDIAIEKILGKMDGLGERTEKLESNQTWFIRAVTGLVISALGILLFKVSGAKPI